MSDAITKLQKEYDDYAYGVSHDLGAPIRQIKAFLELLFDDLEGNQTDDIQEYKTQCFKAIDNADLILDRLLKFSRLNGHEVNLQTTKIINFFPHAEDRLNINIDPEFEMTIDHDLFQIIIDELVDNALKFSDGPTDIYNDGDALMFKTHDATIPDKYCEEIFKSLRTLHAKSDDLGCGMGLAIARKAAEKQNATLWCEANNNCIIMTFS